MIVCLDTHILIWGIKKVADPSQIAKINQSVNFLQWLENERHTIMVPALVLAEFLMPIPVEHRIAIIQLFQSKFIVPSFDAVSATHFANIWQSKNGLRNDITRNVVKVDSMIIAVALANKAQVIYSEDGDLQKIAQEHIEVRNIPNLPHQLELGC